MIRLWLLLPLLLTACTTARFTDDYRPGQETELLAMESWSFSGRIAVNVADDPDASGQASIDWNQSGDISVIRLSGPLGVNAIELLWGPDSVVATGKGVEREIAYSGEAAAEQFMREELGWSFPARSVRFWVRGYADPNFPLRALSYSEGQLTAWQQHGWRAEVLEYQSADGYRVPAKLTMAGHDVKLRMKIAAWNLAQTPD